MPIECPRPQPFPCGRLKPRASPHPRTPLGPLWVSADFPWGPPPSAAPPSPPPIGLLHCTWAPPRLSSGAGPALGQAGAGSGCNYTLPPRTGCHCRSDNANSAGPKRQGRSWKRARPGAPGLEWISFPEGREFPRLGKAGSLNWLLVTSRVEGRRSWVSVPIPAWQPLGTIVPFKPGHLLKAAFSCCLGPLLATARTDGPDPSYQGRTGFDPPLLQITRAYPLFLPSFSGIPIGGWLLARWRVWLVWPEPCAKYHVERGMGECQNVWLGQLQNNLEWAFTEGIFSSANWGCLRRMEGEPGQWRDWRNEGNMGAWEGTRVSELIRVKKEKA